MSDTSGVGYSIAQFFYDPATFAREKNLGPKQELLVKICSVGIEIFTLGIPYLIARSYLKDRVKPVSDAAPLVRETALRVGEVAEDDLSLGRPDEAAIGGEVSRDGLSSPLLDSASQLEEEVVSSITEYSQNPKQEINRLVLDNADIRGLIFDKLELKDLLKMKRVDPPVPGLDEYIVNKFSAEKLYSFKISNPRDPYLGKLIVMRLNKNSSEIRQIMPKDMLGRFNMKSLSRPLQVMGMEEARNGLTHLDLTNVSLTALELDQLAILLPNINHLVISMDGLRVSESKSEFLTALKQFGSLQSLEIKGFNQLADSDLQIIGTLSKLRSFTLSGLDGKVTNEGLRQLRNLPNLEKLCLVGFRSLDGKVLSEIVSRPQFKSLELILEHSSRDFKLAEALEGTDHLENLGVNFFTPMNDADMDAVLRQTNLRSLVVEGCSAVSKSKFEELKNLSRLEVVSLKYANQFPDNVNEIFEASKFGRIYIFDNKRQAIIKQGKLVEFEYRTY